MCIDFPVLKCLPHVCSVVLIRKRAAVFVQSPVDFLALGIGDELGGIGIILESSISPDGNEHSDYALKNEDPGPAAFAPDAIHLRNTPSEKTSKGTGCCCHGEEDGHAQAAFMTFVPHGEASWGQLLFFKRCTAMRLDK